MKLIKLALIILFLLSFVISANAATIDLVRSTVEYTDNVDQGGILEFTWNTPGLSNEEVRYLIRDMPSEFDVDATTVQITTNMGAFDKVIKSFKIALKSTTALNGNLAVKIKITRPSDCPENTYSLKLSEMVGSESDMLNPSSIGISVQKSSTKPSSPALNDPGATDTDGDYTVSWSSVSGATSYTLEEDTSSSFGSPTVVHSGAGTSKYVTGKSDGTYYYRVKACNACGCSGWSNVEDITVEIGNVITVDDSGGADYTRIPDAINNASNGYTIKVFSGNYSEPVVINKSLKLVGENKDTTIIIGGGNGSCVHVTVDNVEISGFTIMNCFDGVYVESSKGIVIDNNIISDNFDGIYIVNSDDNTITHNVITNNIWYVSGIHLISSINNTISDNDIVGNDKGVYLYNSINNRIYHNNFVSNTEQAYDNTGTNLWNHGYPLGGNYWSDYMGSDAYSGPDQNVRGSDGIGDTPYGVSGGVGTQDNYPFMHANGWIATSTIFDTGQSETPYPSIPGTHTGTIKPTQTIEVQKLYTYPCAGTGGHTEFVRISGNGKDKSASWTGYAEDGDAITFDSSFTLEAGKTYNYEIKTGSYPQIHHTEALQTEYGWLNCTKFVDVNGMEYDDWIPAVRFFW